MHPLKLHLIFDPYVQPSPRLTIARLDEFAESWYRRNEPGISVVMRGLQEDTPRVRSEAAIGPFLEEVAKRLALFAKETGVRGEVRIRYGTGRIATDDPTFVARAGREALEALIAREREMDHG